ncbi:MAG: TIGR00266 family protein [Pirellulaceae bacterium]|nr:TIGR00266 family protein [Pirellulaceae bacterium]
MTTINCPACGKQYSYNPQLEGRQVRCQACNHVFQIRNPAGTEGLEIIDGPTAVAGRSGGKRADVIDYEIFGSEMQFCEVTLDPGEMVIAEAGGMMYMTSGIKMETVFGDPSQKGQGFWGKIASAGKRMMTGESLFMTTFSNIANQREVVAFASPYPGKIVPLHLDELGGSIICQKDSFLCGARGVQISIAFQKKIGVAIFGGEGFIMQKLVGDGIALVHAGGTLIERVLAPGETLRLDTGCLVALQTSVNYDIGFVGGFKNTLFGGEGLFLATLTGPGKVWLQSLPFSRLAGRVLAHSGMGGKSADEGSVLNVGSFGNMLLGGGE